MARRDFRPAELVERVDFTETLASMRFRPEDPEPFSPGRFLPGQYATLALEEGNKLVQRAYSLVSSPFEPTLEFFIELVPGGRLTPKLWALRPGDKVLLRNRTAGHFTLADDVHRPRHLMLATVTGVAPFISIARARVQGGARDGSPPERIAVLHGASRARDFGVYAEELGRLARENLMDYVPTISRAWEEPEWPGEVGRVEDVLRKHADRLGFTHDQTIAYACGHPGMVDNALSALKRARFPESALRAEKYFLTPSPESVLRTRRAGARAAESDGPPQASSR